jgi:hypothetical protein
VWPADGFSLFIAPGAYEGLFGMIKKKMKLRSYPLIGRSAFSLPGTHLYTGRA